MLRLSAAGRAKYAAGEILNLLTTDVPDSPVFLGTP